MYEEEQDIRSPDESFKECLLNEQNIDLNMNDETEEIKRVLELSKQEAEEKYLSRELERLQEIERQKEIEELRLNLRPLFMRLSYLDNNNYYTNLINNYIELKKKITKKNKNKLKKIIIKPSIIELIDKYL